MDLLEWEGKELLRGRGVTVPLGEDCHDLEHLRLYLSSSEFPLMIKAQVLAGGRGKAGGIVRVDDLASGLREGRRILGSNIQGKKVRSLLVEPVILSQREIYISLTYEPSSGMPMLMTGLKGGIEVETAPVANFMTNRIEPSHGPAEYQLRAVAKFLELQTYHMALDRLLRSLWNTFWDLDLELLEVNPLILTPNGELITADVKMRINDDSVYRHPELNLDQDRERTAFEMEARRIGLVGVELDGSVAVMANGAGLTMSVMDTLDRFGLRAGAFLDLGGSDDPSRIAKAVGLLLDPHLLPQVRGVLVCVFGGITRCDTVAKGILLGLSGSSNLPIVVRLRGIMEGEGIDILRSGGMPALRDIEGACETLSQRMVKG